MWRLLALHAAPQLPPALLLLLLLLAWPELGRGQLSVPVSNTTQFAAALNNQAVMEIILDPSGVGVRSLAHEATFSLLIACCIQLSRTCSGRQQ